MGTFNFVSSTISPTQITVVDTAVCHTCVGKECVNGSTSQPGQPVLRGTGNLINSNDIQVLGCGTELFAPQIKSNLDCVFCLDCARACPHDNVALALRNPLGETSHDNWSARWDLSLLVIIYAFASLGNAFGMVPPFFVLQAWLANLLNTTNEALLLLLIFGTILLLLPVGLSLLAAWLSRALAQRPEPLRQTLGRYAPAFAPLGFAIWLAHYGGFHFLTSALTIVPVTQNFLQDHGLTFLGEPDWTMAAIVPPGLLDGLELGVVLLGLLASLYVLGQRAKLAPQRVDGPVVQLPWLLLLLGLALTAVWLFTRILFPAIHTTSTSGWNIWFGGFTASVALTIMGSTFGNNGQEILLLPMFSVIGWVLYALGQWGRGTEGAGNMQDPATGWLSQTLFLGLMTAWPLIMLDPGETLLLMMGDPLAGSVLGATRTTFALVGVASIALALGHKRLPRFPDHGWPIIRLTASAWLIGIVVFWFVSIPGFHGDTLFVILKDQADLSGAQAIRDPLERRQFVYDTLVAHADTSQASLRDALDSRFISYKPYYLVNALEVRGGTYMRTWLSNQPEVDRVLTNPYLRPTPELMGKAMGTAVAPTSPDWNLTMIGADRVWNELGVRGAGIIIGQSDSGAEWTHPELQDSYRGRDGSHDYNWFDPWYGDPEPNDLGGHGTHTLGSVLGNSVGVAPEAEWMACANLQRNLGNPAYYLDCMQFMLAPHPANGDPFTTGRPELGANVLNNSWGCPAFEGCDPLTFQGAVAALREAGVYVVVSAGNDGLLGCETVTAPLALYDEVFTVGAHNREGLVTEFSSRGPVSVDGSGRIKPDILAPGAGVLSAYPNGTYEYADGTSMAGPH
ncbi:MAG: S8 family serine peptidase, partial [Anaerolineales bacterium]|nr:S8 family serine peptidase [Anaerolineales bacterium]